MMFNKGELSNQLDEGESEKALSLLTTAPELLEALEGMIKWTNGTAMHYLENAELLPKSFEKWTQLIQKAKGVQNVRFKRIR